MYKKLFLIFIGLSIFSLVLSVCSSKEKESKNINVENFSKEFQERIKNSKSEIFKENIGDLEKNKDGYKIVLDASGNSILFIEVDKNDNVEKVDLATATKSVEEYTSELHIAYNWLIQIVDPSLDLQQTINIKDKLKIPNVITLDDTTNVLKYNNINYTYHINGDAIILEIKY